MTEHLRADVCVIGGGSGGLTVAAGAAQLGATTILVERGAMGGDCLNYGCVPSKSLIAAARAAEGVRTAGRFGIRAAPPTIDFRAVHDHVKGVIAAIAPHDSVERFTALGVRVIAAHARFVAPDRIEAGPFTITARRFVVATGSGPATPAVPGLDQVPYLTNETIFDRTEAPGHLVVLGGGPIGVEMAQAHRLLGAAVTVVQAGRLLPRDDAEAVELLTRRLRHDGIVLEENAKVVRVEKTGSGVALILATEGGERRVEGSHLLVAAGRRPHLADLGLEAAGIAHTERGITVDARLRTSNGRVYAIGDCAGGPQFTHIAGYHAGVVIRNLLFRLPAKVDYRALPWTTYTTPELAHVGLTEDAARARHGRIGILRFPFAENDRARTERAETGLVKVVTTPGGKVLGVTILGEHAGEVIQLWSLAIAKGLGVKDVAGLILPYPTLGEANKRAAGAFFLPKLFAPRTRRLVRFLLRFA